MATFIFFCFAVIVMFFIFRRFGGNEKERSQEFAELAKHMGMSFSIKSDSSFRKQLKQFIRFSSSHNAQAYRTSTIKNILREESGNLTFVFFECTPSGDNNRIGVMEGILCFRSSALNLPDFRLQSKFKPSRTLLHASNEKEINLSGCAKVEERYRLTGSDEIALEKVFSASLQTFFGDVEDNLYIEGRQNHLIISRSCDLDWKTGKQPKPRVDPHEFKQFKQQVTHIYELFV